MLRLLRQSENTLLRPGQGDRSVQHHQREARPLRRGYSPVHADPLHAVPGISDTRRVTQPQHLTAQADLFLHRIPGGARHLGDDGPVIAQKGIEQGRFPRVGQAQQHRGDALPQDTPPAEGIQQPLQLPAAAGQGIGNLPLLQGLDILVGIVHRRIEAGGDVHKPVIHLLHTPAYAARELQGGVLGALGRLGIDEIRHGLRLDEIHPPAEKGPPGKFTPLGLPGAECEGAAQHLLQHHCRPVAVQLRRPLAGIAALRGEYNAQAVVNDRTLRRAHVPVHHPAVGQRGGALSAAGGKYAVHHGQSLRPGYAHDADGCRGPGGGNGGYGIGHGFHAP